MLAETGVCQLALTIATVPQLCDYKGFTVVIDKNERCNHLDFFYRSFSYTQIHLLQNND